MSYTDELIPLQQVVSYVLCLKANRYKTDKRMQAAFFWLSCIAGTRLIWLMNRGNWLVVMRQVSSPATASQLQVRAEVLVLSVPANSDGLDLRSGSVEPSPCSAQPGRGCDVYLVQGLQTQHLTYGLITQSFGLGQYYISVYLCMDNDGYAEIDYGTGRCLLDDTPHNVLRPSTRAAPYTSPIVEGASTPRCGVFYMLNDTPLSGCGL